MDVVPEFFLFLLGAFFMWFLLRFFDCSDW